jgi:hypothetical protein
MSDIYNREEATNGEVDGEKLPTYDIIRSVQLGKNLFKLFTAEYIFILSYCDCSNEFTEAAQIYYVDVYSYEKGEVELIRSYNDVKNPHARKVFWFAMVLAEIIGE